MRALIVIPLLLSMGCAMQRAAFAEKAASASDAEFESATWASCQTPTLGALLRRFSNLDDLTQYIEHCVWMRSSDG